MVAGNEADLIGTILNSYFTGHINSKVLLACNFNGIFAALNVFAGM